MQLDPQDDPYAELLAATLSNSKQQPVAPALMNISSPVYTNLSSGTPQQPQQSGIQGLAGVLGGINGIAGSLAGTGTAAPAAGVALGGGGAAATALPAVGLSHAPQPGMAMSTNGFGNPQMLQGPPPPGSAEAAGAHPVKEQAPWHPGPTDWQHSLIGRLFYKPAVRGGGADPGPSGGPGWRGPPPNYKSGDVPPPPGSTKTSPLGMSAIQDPTIHALSQQIMPASPRAGRFENPDMGIGTSPRAAAYEDPTLNLGGMYGGY